MTINQMRFFVEVCNKGSITKAKEALHVTQPAISQAIQEMEREHGVKLFNRTNNGLELTREGSFMLLDVKDILDKIDLLSQKMSYLDKNKHTIRLGMPPMIAIGSMDIIAEYKRLHPYISFDFFHESSPLLRRRISEGAIDLCLATGDNSGLYHCEITRLAKCEVCVCVSPEHEFAARDSVTWDEVVKEKLVVYKDHYQIGQAIQHDLSKHLRPDQELFETNNTTIQLNLITKYNYCGFVYRSMAEQHPGIVGVSLAEPVYVDVDLITRINSKQNKDISRLIEYIQAEYR